MWGAGTTSGALTRFYAFHWLRNEANVVRSREIECQTNCMQRVSDLCVFAVLQCVAGLDIGWHSTVQNYIIAFSARCKDRIPNSYSMTRCPWHGEHYRAVHEPMTYWSWQHRDARMVGFVGLAVVSALPSGFRNAVSPRYICLVEFGDCTQDDMNESFRNS